MIKARKKIKRYDAIFSNDDLLINSRITIGLHNSPNTATLAWNACKIMVELSLIFRVLYVLLNLYAIATLNRFDEAADTFLIASEGVFASIVSGILKLLSLEER